MSLHDADLLAIDAVVCRGIGKRPGQTILQRAREILADPFAQLRGQPDRAAILRACRSLMSDPSADSWDRMRLAARILAPIVKGEP